MHGVVKMVIVQTSFVSKALLRYTLSMQEFWASNLAPGASVEITPSHPLHLSNVSVAFDFSDAFVPTSLVLSVVLADRCMSPRYTIATLIAGQSNTKRIDVRLDHGVRYVLTVHGPNALSIFGYHIQLPDIIWSAPLTSANDMAPPSVIPCDAVNNPRLTSPLPLASHSAVAENVHPLHAVNSDANVMSSRAMKSPGYHHRHVNPSLRNTVPNYNQIQASKRVKTGDWTFANRYPSTEDDSNQQDGLITQETNNHKRKSTTDSGSHRPGAMSGANQPTGPSQFSQFRFPMINMHPIQNSTRTPSAGEKRS
ncbi:hypothetical protein F5878DRAFT_647228 [Lentinula raphanica]|uniref:Nucleoplasmin-like domain-containing protein n=1 Tax=Lentinula raphanica TaxID=153919 RepID=A0AA38NWG4_9AGAR|nr:hypothetical protein F5878DRAFT_647228 [Lentinula raphanica]